MHPLVPAVLFGMPEFDALDLDSEAEPPDRQFAQAVERMSGGKGQAVVRPDGVRQPYAQMRNLRVTAMDMKWFEGTNLILILLGLVLNVIATLVVTVLIPTTPWRDTIGTPVSMMPTGLFAALTDAESSIWLPICERSSR
jgi:hypothetical protein